VLGIVCVHPRNLVPSRGEVLPAVGGVAQFQLEYAEMLGVPDLRVGLRAAEAHQPGTSGPDDELTHTRSVCRTARALLRETLVVVVVPADDDVAACLLQRGPERRHFRVRRVTGA
jgi:hypothetical protein